MNAGKLTETQCSVLGHIGPRTGCNGAFFKLTDRATGGHNSREKAHQNAINHGQSNCRSLQQRYMWGHCPFTKTKHFKINNLAVSFPSRVYAVHGVKCNIYNLSLFNSSQISAHSKCYYR